MGIFIPKRSQVRKTIYLTEFRQSRPPVDYFCSDLCFSLNVEEGCVRKINLNVQAAFN